MIEAWHVREALRSRFGSALVDQPGIWDRAASLLQHYAPYRDTFEGLAAQLEDVIFMGDYVMLSDPANVTGETEGDTLILTPKNESARQIIQGNQENTRTGQ